VAPGGAGAACRPGGGRRIHGRHRTPGLTGLVQPVPVAGNTSGPRSATSSLRRGALDRVPQLPGPWLWCPSREPPGGFLRSGYGIPLRTQHRVSGDYVLLSVGINFAVGRITCAAPGHGLSYDAVLGVTFVSRCNSGRGTGLDVRRGGTLSVSCWVILWLLHRLMVFLLSPCEHRFRPGNVLTRCPHPAPEPSGFPFRRVLPHSLSGHPVQRGQQ
jgi:hypothetical protein